MEHYTTHVNQAHMPRIQLYESICTLVASPITRFPKLTIVNSRVALGMILDRLEKSLDLVPALFSP